MRPEAAFDAHPDQRVKHVGISVNQHLERFDLRSGRENAAKRYEALRLQLISCCTTYEAQLKVEQDETRNQFLNKYGRLLAPLTEERYTQLVAFSGSESFERIPTLSIRNRLTAAILTRRTRPIQRSDNTDIEFLSAYLPYIDVVCTDTFMADQLRSLHIDTEFNVLHFTAKTSSLRDMKTFLRSTRAIRPLQIRRVSQCSSFHHSGAANSLTPFFIS